jgi:hypothetical protein
MSGDAEQPWRHLLSESQEENGSNSHLGALYHKMFSAARRIGRRRLDHRIAGVYDLLDRGRLPSLKGNLPDHESDPPP